MTGMVSWVLSKTKTVDRVNLSILYSLVELIFYSVLTIGIAIFHTDRYIFSLKITKMPES